MDVADVEKQKRRMIYEIIERGQLIKMPFMAKKIKWGVAMEINRDVYLERLIVRKHNGFIKVITGIL